MQPKNLFAILLALVMALSVVGYQRWSASQRQLAISGLNPGTGVSMIHFYADW